MTTEVSHRDAAIAALRGDVKAAQEAAALLLTKLEEQQHALGSAISQGDQRVKMSLRASSGDAMARVEAIEKAVVDDARERRREVESVRSLVTEIANVQREEVGASATVKELTQLQNQVRDRAPPPCWSWLQLATPVQRLSLQRRLCRPVTTTHGDATSYELLDY